MRHVLATDGGGTKTEAVVIGETGQVVGWARGGPAHALYTPMDEIKANYRQAVTAATAGLQSEGVWLALDRPGGHFDAQVELDLPILGSVAINEFTTALASAQQEWGMIVHSGTGSFVAASQPDRTMIHRGGMGPIIGDYGSAYEIGRLGLRAAFLCYYPGCETSLSHAVPEHWGLTALGDVFNLVYRDECDRRKMASLAKVVDEQAELGDAVATRCLMTGADSLADFAVELTQTLGWSEQSFALIASGSVAQNSRLWWARVVERVRAVAPEVRPLQPQVRPVVGGALEALRAMGVAWTPELLARIIETQQPFLEALRNGSGKGSEAQGGAS
jgi:glucosamine kinase